jgi:predicted TIM-barrel fold metal-dependent hydrolase
MHLPIARRHFLGGLAAAGAGVLVSDQAFAQNARTPRPVIDIHHHLSPRGFIAAIHDHHTNQLPLENWTPAKSIEDMDAAGVTTAITSISEPGVWFGDDAAARRLARECNDYAATLQANYPGRFRTFGTLPMPDIDGSLHEIAYIFDVLKADGVCLLTSYGGKYLGNPAFTPVLDELNRRKAVVFTHPVKADCCRNLVPEIGPNTIELATDTSRAIAEILFSGSAARFPDIRWIFSHAGGTVPFLVQRFLNAAKSAPAGILPHGLLPELQRFYYDTANAFTKYPLSALIELVPKSQILFGTDYPFVTAKETLDGLRSSGLFSAGDLSAITSENATRLLRAGAAARATP